MPVLGERAYLASAGGEGALLGERARRANAGGKGAPCQCWGIGRALPVPGGIGRVLPVLG